ncbi:acyclic terpene utilization AtuA family protein [uncultured Roseobacter sp.]|uniref:acyclic terpene utilization AtuA family protein n=1 Tax=uncultured Roseobacter sp. TaxID=114847 RepID=UPI00262F5AC6|nr:acyclic terpene utilization AtuA family protein [uncultured Roseobacter sp.]
MTRVLIPSGALGLNYDPEALARGLAAKPDIIAIDGGSTDSGPSYLGRGVSKYARASTKLEWAGLMAARAKAGVPLVIGTAGTCGTDSAVDWMLDITREIASENGTTLKVAVLRSSQDPDRIAQSFETGEVTPLPGAPEVSTADIRACANIVALAGIEQIAAAIETGADIIIAGRTTDTAIIAALPLMQGCHAGGAWHGAKIGECGALCATNPQSGVILIDFDTTGFTVTPLADGAHASPHTVSAHMLYENSDPFILHEPGGHLDVTAASYTALNDTSVRVEGSKWVPSDRYTVKLEGARPAGARTVVMALLRDPRYVANAAAWADDIVTKCTAKVLDRMNIRAEDFRLEIRLMGQSASFGALETRTGDPVEIGAIGIITAPSEAQAAEIGKLLNPYLLHHPLTQEEEQPTFAFLFSPPEMHQGIVHEFALHHVLHLENPMDAFRLEVVDIG